MTANPVSPLAPANGSTTSPPVAGRRPVEPMRVLRQYKWLLLASIPVGLIVGLALWLMLGKIVPDKLAPLLPQRYRATLRKTRVFTSESLLVVSEPLDNPWGPVTEQGEVGGRGSRMDMIEAYIENHIIALQSYDLLMNVIEHPDVKKTAWYQSMGTLEERLEKMLEDLRPIRMRDSTTIRVIFRAFEEAEPEIILDRVIREFMHQYETDTRRRGSDVRQIFDREQLEREDEINRRRRQMEQFRKSKEIETLETAKSEAAIEYEKVAEARALKQLEMDSYRAYYITLLQTQDENRVVPTAQDMATVKSTPTVAERVHKLASLGEYRQIMREKFGPNHRAVVAIDQQIRAAEQLRDQEMERQLRELQSVRLEMTRKSIEASGKQLEALMVQKDLAQARMRDLLDRVKEYEGMEKELAHVEERRDRVAEVLDGERMLTRRPDVLRIGVKQMATAPEMTFPDIYIMTFGMTLLSLGLVTGVVFLKESLDQRIKTPSDLSSLPAAELLGIIPDAEQDPSGPIRAECVVRQDPTGLMAEAFRQIRTAVMGRMDRRGYKTLLLCGVQARCGVSAVTNNLALSLAYNNRKVIVVDANFRRPAHHELFGVELVPGLVEVLQGQVTLDKAIFHHAKPDLDVLPTGAASSSPPELLEGSAFRSLLIELEKKYDLILLDGPPALVTSDSIVLAKQVDAMVVVVRAMNEKRGMVMRMLGAMQDQRADLMGVILNCVRSSAGGYMRKNYREFYRYRQPAVQPRRRQAERTVATESRS